MSWTKAVPIGLGSSWWLFAVALAALPKDGLAQFTLPRIVRVIKTTDAGRIRACWTATRGLTPIAPAIAPTCSASFYLEQ